jgi:hypothetical protein
MEIKEAIEYGRDDLGSSDCAWLLERLEAAEAVLMSGGRIDYQNALTKWRRLKVSE